MDSTIIVFGAILMVVYIAFQVYSYNRSESTEHLKKQRPTPSSPSATRNKLYQARKDDTKPIHSDEVTLIANVSFVRDEILGTIDIIEGLHPIPAKYPKSDVIRFWIFIGYHNMSFDTEFKKEVQAIIADMKRQNWSVESTSNIGRKEICLLTRSG